MEIPKKFEEYVIRSLKNAFLHERCRLHTHELIETPGGLGKYVAVKKKSKNNFNNISVCVSEPDAYFLGKNFYLPIEIKYFIKSPWRATNGANDNKVFATRAKLKIKDKARRVEEKYLNSTLAFQKYSHPFVHVHPIGKPILIKTPRAEKVALVVNFIPPPDLIQYCEMRRICIISAFDELEKFVDLIPESTGINRQRVRAALIKEKEKLNDSPFAGKKF